VFEWKGVMVGLDICRMTPAMILQQKFVLAVYRQYISKMEDLNEEK
jgi:hypothetical protein